MLTGEDKLGRPRREEIVYRGQVSDREKGALRSGDVAFVMPSRWESFSIATLEAMAQRTPVLVNGGSPVLAQHAARSGAGRSYTDDESFCRALDGLLDAPGERAEMGERGRAYVLSRYQAGHIREALVREVESLTPGRTHRAALGLFRHFLACSLRAGVY